MIMGDENDDQRDRKSKVRSQRSVAMVTPKVPFSNKSVLHFVLSINKYNIFSENYRKVIA